MKTIRLESTDADNITTSTTVIVDFDSERSVELAFIDILKYLERVGLRIPPDLAQLMSNSTPGKRILRG